MRYKFVTAIMSVVCVLLMMGMTFQPAAASRGADGTVMHPDMFIDMDGNKHQVYSELVRYYVTIGNAQVPKWQAEVFYKNNVGLDRGWNAPIQISDTMADSVWPQVSVDSSTGIIYVSWIEEGRESNKFWYAGSSNGGESFTAQRYGAAAPWPVAPNLDMAASQGILTFTWRPSGMLELVADIDGDMIPDFHDAEPMVYNTDNFAIEIEPDVIATDNDLGVTVAIDYGGEDDTFPTVTSATGNFAVSTGDYIEINLETDADFSAIIKMQIPGEIPSNLRESCLRFYRLEGENWVVVTDWELEEFTGINIEHGFVWAYVKHFSTFTTADASQWDGDKDGLTDLTEDTEPSPDVPISLTEEYFNVTDIQTDPEGITYLSFDIEPYNSYLAVRGSIEIALTSAQPIEELELDIGDNGRIDWRAPTELEGTLRFGSIKNAISDYMFKNYLNSDATLAVIPFRFISSTPGEFLISEANIVIEDVTTCNRKADTSGDGLYDGWVDSNGDFVFQREGEDGILGTESDEIPGALALNMDPTEMNLVGSTGIVHWNEYQEGINQVNGNLVLSSLDLEMQVFGNTMMLERSYNSFNSDIPGPFGYGWSFNYGEKLVSRDGSYYVDFHSGGGSYHEFELLGWDSTNRYYSSLPGMNVNLIYDGTFYKLMYTDGTVKRFSSNGILNSITDKNNNHLSMTYDGENLLSVSGYFINFLSFTYDDDGMITAITDRAGRKNTYAYQDGKLVSRTDAMGNEYRYEYNPEGKISTVINPMGMYREYQYSPDFPHQVTRCTVGEYDLANSPKSPDFISYDAEYTHPSQTTARDANGWPTTRYFGNHGEVKQTRYPDGSVVSKKFDTSLNVVKVIDGLGQHWEYLYDPISNMKSEIDASGSAYQIEFENTVSSSEYISLITKIRNRNDYVFRFEYDNNKNPSVMTDKDGFSTDYIYSSRGLLLEQTLPNGAITIYSYSLGNLIKETDALGNFTTYTYDIINRNTGMTDARGFTTGYEYDALDRVVRITDPLGNEETYTYDALGNVLVFSDKTGATTAYEYDVFGRNISETDALGNVSSFEYDLKGNLIKEIDKRGNSTHYIYDKMDRLVSVTDALGYSETYTYDANGNQLERIDKLGNVWYNYYDELGRVTHEFCPYHVAIRYEYDAEGRTTKRIDRLGYETVYEYDARGNRVRELGAEGSDTKYRYDAVGNFDSVSQCDGALLPNGTHVTDPFYPMLRWQLYDDYVQPPQAIYHITNIWELQNMSADLDGSYALANDIDASVTSTWNGGMGFTPVGTMIFPFTGSFDGQGFTITGLYIDQPYSDVGLFGRTNGAMVQNVGLIDIIVRGSFYCVGGIIGILIDSTLTNSYASGIVNGNDSVGGLVGYNGGGGTVTNSYATGTVRSSGLGRWIGGIIGRNYGTVSNSYATGIVSGNTFTGGFVGYNSGTIENSYSTGRVNGTDHVGGLVGNNGGTVTNSYAIGIVSGNTFTGGLVGNNVGTVTNSFYDMETTGQSDDTGKGLPRTTAEMKDQSTFTGWNFANMWWMPIFLESSTWQYGYDLLGRKISETTPLNFTYSWEYDEVGNMIEYKDANGQKTFYKYDALNRLTNLTMPGAFLQGRSQINITYLITESERQEYGYPPIMVLYGGARMLPVPSRMHALEKEYDVLGRLVREMWAVTDIDAFQVGDTDFYNITYQYDENGNVIEMTDQFDLVTTYQYDELNRLVALTDPDGDTTTYQYDPLGQLVLTAYPSRDEDVDEDVDEEVEGVLRGTLYFRGIEDEHSPGNYLLNNNQSDNMAWTGSVGFWSNVYGGIRVYVTDMNGEIVEELTPGEPVAVALMHRNDMYSVTWTPPETYIDQTDSLYVELYARNSLPLRPEDLRATFATEPLGLDSIDTTEWTVSYRGIHAGFVGGGSGIVWGDPGNNTRIDIFSLHPFPDGTGTRIYREYNAANLLTGVWNVKSTGEVISSFEYNYDFNANRISMTEANNITTTYAYDKENRLTQVTYPDGTQTQYQYDRRNNMASTTTITETATETTAMTYDMENRLMQSGDKTFEYDSNGNQIRGDTVYGYYSTFLDGRKVKWLNSVGWPATPPTTYGYALDGRRVGKTGAVDMKYLYDGENVIYELWDDKTVRFTHPVASGSCGSCGPCGNGGGAFFTDHPISISINGVKYYYLYDGLGSVTELIDVNENVVNVYRYSPFGDALIREETVYNPHQYTGRQYDAESGLYHYRARAYSPDIGRFMQQDPAGMIDGPNMYAYVGNNPVNRRDPSGMKMEMDERKFSDCLSENIENIGLNLLTCLLTVVTAKAVLFHATTIFGSAALAKFTMGVTVPISLVAVVGWVSLLLTCFQTSPAAYDAWKDVLKCGWDALGSSEDLWYPENSVMMNYPLAYSPGSMIYQWGLPGPMVTNWMYSGRNYNPKAGWWMI